MSYIEIFWSIWGVIACSSAICFIIGITRDDNIVGFGILLLIMTALGLVVGAFVFKTHHTELTPRKVVRIEQESLTIVFYEDSWYSTEEPYIFGLPESEICIHKSEDINCYTGHMQVRHEVIKCKK